MRRFLFPVIVGLGGILVLGWLGMWQLDRLEWKQAILAQIDERRAQEPIPLPPHPTEETDEYRTVLVSGAPTGEELHVLVSGTGAGTGYRVVSHFVTDDGRQIMLDQGLLSLEDKELAPFVAPMEIQGTLLWPDEVTSSTPAPDRDKDIWFARDINAMAQALGTEATLVVLDFATQYDPRLATLPVETVTIPNDHLEYAITWFLLAIVWFSMSLYWVIRVMRRKDKELE